MSEPVNPYAAPEADLVVEGPLDDLIPADRGARLGANFVQAMLLLVPVFLFVVVLSSLSESELAMGLVGVFLLLYWGGYFAVTVYLLHTQGQTIGKKLFGICIVDAQTGLPASALRILFLRYGVMGVLGQIPLIGALLGLANILFIFREDQRCIHDHIAGTRVVVKPIRLDL